MKQLLLTLVTVLTITVASVAQTVTVNNKDLNSYDYIDVYTAIKPFSTKEAIFIDTGDNNFKKQNYDATKNQRIYWDGEKLKSGNVMKVKKYLLQNGWIKADESETHLGDTRMIINTYTRTKG